MGTEAKTEEATTETTPEAPKKRGRPKGSTNKPKATQKKKRGRPKGSTVKKTAAKKTTKKAPTKRKTTARKPKTVKKAVQTPADLISFMKDAKSRLEAGKSAAPKVIHTIVEELATTQDRKRERILISQLQEIKALSN